MKGPETIIWLITARCNLSCSHCYAAKFIGSEELDRETALRLVYSAAAAGVKHLGLSGGEVFMRPDALGILELAASLGMTTSVVSNGLPLKGETLQRLARYGTYIFLSLDGATQETHERVRGKGMWERTLQAASRLKRAGVPFSTIMAVSKENASEVAEFIELTRELGAWGACIIPVMATGRATAEMTLSPAEMLQVLKEADRMASHLSFPVSLWCLPFAGLVSHSGYVLSHSCRRSRTMDIDPAGNVLLCDVLDTKLTNVKDREIIEVWQEQESHPLVRALGHPELREPCLDCPLRRKCQGGCFARAYINGDLYAPDPLCPRAAGLMA